MSKASLSLRHSISMLLVLRAWRQRIAIASPKTFVYRISRGWKVVGEEEHVPPTSPKFLCLIKLIQFGNVLYFCCSPSNPTIGFWRILNSLVVSKYWAQPLCLHFPVTVKT